MLVTVTKICFKLFLVIKLSLAAQKVHRSKWEHHKSASKGAILTELSFSALSHSSKKGVCKISPCRCVCSCSLRDGTKV